MRRSRRRASALALALAAWLVASAAWGYTLDEIRHRGVLRVAVYSDFAPFSHGERGIDVEVARALAARLGVKLSLMPFPASDESVEDDLRNMVWKGHYLGYGPADVMLHVPVAPELAANKRVRIFGAYFRDGLAIARRTDRLPTLDSLDALRGVKVGAETGGLASTVLLGYGQGALNGNVVHVASGHDVALDVKTGRTAAGLARRSELEAVLHGVDAIAIEAPPVPLLKGLSWPLGMAVTAENAELAAALDEAVRALVDAGTLRAIFAAEGVTWRAP
ncbi:MAG: substrate-binding periplasmic protein [Betaproteobacteria bacterium]